jgi:hypothetical protein
MKSRSLRKKYLAYTEKMLSGNCWSMLIEGGVGHWTSPVQLSSSTTNVQPDYTVAINTNKIVVVSWTAYDYTVGVRNVYVSKAKIGGSWSAAVQLSN